MIILNEELSFIEKSRKFVSHHERNSKKLKATRKTVLTNKHSCISKVKFKVNAEDVSYD